MKGMSPANEPDFKEVGLIERAGRVIIEIFGTYSFVDSVGYHQGQDIASQPQSEISLAGNSPRGADVQDLSV